jgi:hypothetical protein
MKVKVASIPLIGAQSESHLARLPGFLQEEMSKMREKTEIEDHYTELCKDTYP